MSSFGSVLRELRKENTLTQTELADKLGLACSTISMYERGDREPDFKVMEAIADFFNVTIDYLHGKANASKQPFISPEITKDFTTFPVIGSIAAGFDSIAYENWSGETVDIPNSYLKGHERDDYFVLCVKGDSMYPIYQNGDYVLILRQTTLNKSGDVGAVLYDDENATLKKVEYQDGEDWLNLVPFNPIYKPEKIEGERLEHCKILGIPKVLIRNIEE